MIALRAHIQLFREWLSYKRRKAYATMSKVIMDSGKSLVVVVFDSLAVEKSYEERLQTPAAFVRKLLSGK